jgi:hypothetical protein
MLALPKPASAAHFDPHAQDVPVEVL